MNLNTSSNVNPISRKGSRRSHTMGRIKINTNANGQHITSKMNQRITAMIVFMNLLFRER